MAAPKGHKRYGGRKPGSVNKVTAEVKAALVKAFEDIGGVESFAKWGKANRTEFYKLWAKLLPTEIANADGETLKLQLVESIVDANPSHLTDHITEHPPSLSAVRLPEE